MVTSKTTRPAAGPGRGNFSIKGETRKARRERLVEEVCQLYLDVVRDSEQPISMRLSAGQHLLLRIDGPPREPDTLTEDFGR